MDMFWSSVADPTQEGSDNHYLKGFKQLCPGKDPKNGMCLQMAECASNPRILKSHLPLSLLTPSMLDTCKVRGNSFR